MIQILCALLLVTGSGYAMDGSGTGMRQRSSSFSYLAEIERQKRDKQKLEKRLARHQRKNAEPALIALCQQGLEDQEAHMKEYLREFASEIAKERAATAQSADTKRKSHAAQLHEPLLAGDSSDEDSDSDAEEQDEPAQQYEPKDMRDLQASAHYKEAFVKAFQRTTQYAELIAYLKDKAANANQRLDDNHQMSVADVDRALDIFLKKLSDEAYPDIKNMFQAIDKELRNCRGKKIGCFAYSIWSSQWARNVQDRHFDALPRSRLVKLVYTKCMKENVGDVRLQTVFGFIEEDLRRNQHENARLLFHELKKSHKTGYKNWFHHMYMNPRRVLFVLLAAAAVAGGAYYYFTRDY